MLGTVIFFTLCHCHVDIDAWCGQTQCCLPNVELNTISPINKFGMTENCDQIVKELCIKHCHKPPTNPSSGSTALAISSTGSKMLHVLEWCGQTACCSLQKPGDVKWVNDQGQQVVDVCKQEHIDLCSQYCKAKVEKGLSVIDSTTSCRICKLVVDAASHAGLHCKNLMRLPPLVYCALIAGIPAFFLIWFLSFPFFIFGAIFMPCNIILNAACYGYLEYKDPSREMRDKGVRDTLPLDPKSINFANVCSARGYCLPKPSDTIQNDFSLLKKFNEDPDAFCQSEQCTRDPYENDAVGKNESPTIKQRVKNKIAGALDVCKFRCQAYCQEGVYDGKRVCKPNEILLQSIKKSPEQEKKILESLQSLKKDPVKFCASDRCKPKWKNQDWFSKCSKECQGFCVTKNDLGKRKCVPNDNVGEMIQEYFTKVDIKMLELLKKGNQAHPALCANNMCTRMKSIFGEKCTWRCQPFCKTDKKNRCVPKVKMRPNRRGL